MTCAVLCIGTELTRGELVNTNAAWLASSLTDLGFDVVEDAVVDDDHDRIVATVKRLSAEHDFVVCTGGLGPTTDDLTSTTVADVLGVKMVRDEESLDVIARRIAKFGRSMTPANAKQADFPEGATILPNPVGTAPGFGVKLGKCEAFFMPGVPTEMKKMFDEQVVPRIRERAPSTSYQTRLRTFGLPESVVGEKLAGVEEDFPGVIIGYRAHFPEIEVKVLAHAKSLDEARDLSERATVVVRQRLGAIVYGGAEDTFAGVAGRVLRQKGQTLAIAESCTGGLVGSLFTREPGASEFLLVDAVTYANSAKTKLLGIDEEILRAHGAVSREVAEAMALGVRRVSGADIALSLTGIAGPTGGTEAKPVGTVWIALATASGVEAKHTVFPGDRQRIQTFAAYAGIEMVRRACLA